MTHRCNLCPGVATTALVWLYGDKVRHAKIACETDADLVIEYQATLGETVERRPLDAVSVELQCLAFWRPHGCYLAEGHDGPHTCEASCNHDQPDENDNVWFGDRETYSGASMVKLL